MKSEATRAKMSASAKDRCTKEWREAMSMRLRHAVDEQKIVSMYIGGQTQDEVATSMSGSRKVVSNVLKRNKVKSRPAAKRNQWGAANTGWRGEKASLTNKHRRLYRAFGQPKVCDVCGTDDPKRTYDWANLTGDYDNPADFKRMCRSCHWKYDKKHLNFHAK